MSKVARKDLTRFALEMVVALRGHAAGVIKVEQFKGWTKEELHGTADLLLEGLREERPEVIESLQKLYEETGGTPFKAIYYGT